MFDTVQSRAFLQEVEYILGESLDWKDKQIVYETFIASPYNTTTGAAKAVLHSRAESHD